MALSVRSLARAAGDPVYYDPGFRLLLETHLPLFQAGGVVSYQPISPDRLHQFEGDFYGLLSSLDVPLEWHWLYLRLNGLENSAHFGKEAHDPYHRPTTYHLKVPSEDLIRHLRSLYLSINTTK